MFLQYDVLGNVPIHFLWWVVFLYISVIDMVCAPVSTIVRKRMPQNLLDIQEQCICKVGEIQRELKLLFDVYYSFLKLYTKSICISLHMGFCRERAAAGLGPSGLNPPPRPPIFSV